jgi:hypothetical protein
VDDSIGSKSPLSIIAMAASRIIRNLSLRTSADSGEVCDIVIGRTEASTTSRVFNACRVLLLKVVGLVMVFCASDGIFMVVIVNCCRD